MAKIDYILDRITMYRVVLYLLIGLIGVATILAAFKVLAFSPLALLASTAFLIIICWAMNTILAFMLNVPANVESVYITALILALIIDPAQSVGAFLFLGWAAILAMSSKYILALRKKHIFNPAAIAVVITAFVLNQSASWWVGTVSMLPFVLIGGLLVARKLRQEDMVLSFCAAVIVGIALITLVQGRSVTTALYQVVVQSPLFFFAFIMLTEPLTAPPTKNLRRVYGALIGLLFMPQVHLGSIYSTPELALVLGNVFSYLVSPKQKVVLTLNRKIKMGHNVFDFVFRPSQKLTYRPGQYMEFTLAHPHADSRGNRRYFTLASSPTENFVHLGIRFYDQGSSFKQAMFQMNGKTQFVAAQIAGDFTLPTDPTQKLVFIAGGIGITPFRSMLKYLLDTQQRRDIVMFYANRRADEIVYKDVLSEVQAKLGIRTFYTLTDTAAVPRNWSAFVGRIQEQMLLDVLPDYLERTYYLSGPPDMVRAYEQVLKNLQVRHEQIKKDFFPGLV
ncbi:NQR2_RnfD_RnfE and FNR_like domain-containing protein [Ktedonobacteria bacterium brp13]|nr:NQR2_RnfD_RnfE and FNR_like domain-containing protein [Ktedonobacteria bacterium brp13]